LCFGFQNSIDKLLHLKQRLIDFTGLSGKRNGIAPPLLAALYQKGGSPSNITTGLLFINFVVLKAFRVKGWAVVDRGGIIIALCPALVVVVIFIEFPL
jgi:hypothetical protein